MYVELALKEHDDGRAVEGVDVTQRCYDTMAGFFFYREVELFFRTEAQTNAAMTDGRDRRRCR